MAAQLTTDEIKEIYKERDHTLREQWVKVYEARLVREELQKCHRAEGVNHYENCHHLVQHYLELLKDSKITGWRKIDPRAAS